VGILWAIVSITSAFEVSSFLPIVFQPYRLEVVLLTISWKVELEGQPWKTGKPKYLPKDSLCETLNIALTTCLWACDSVMHYGRRLGYICGTCYVALHYYRNDKDIF